jgi:hypothetical protein
MPFNLSDRVVQLEVKTLVENPENWQLHGQFDPMGKDKKLCADVAREGVLLPILVLPNGQIIDGHRRRRAAMTAKLETIPGIVSEIDDADQAYASAQLGRNMSIYAKCLLFRKEIEAVANASTQTKQANLTNSTKNESKMNVNDEWVTLELILGTNRRALVRGLKLLRIIDDLNASGDYDQAGRVRQVFRDRGIAPARRMLGIDSHDQPSEESDEADCLEWSIEDDTHKNGRRGKTGKKNKKRTPAPADKTPPSSAAEKPADKWQKDANKHLAELERILKEHKCFSSKVQQALDVVEEAIGWKNQQGAA